MAQLGSSKVFGNLQVTGNIVAGTTITGTTLSISGTATAVTFSGALSGNATTATTLQTARTINETSFNGSANITLNQLYRHDDRTISPSEITTGYMRFGFGAWNNNGVSPYADYLHLRSYTDSSGGNDNLVMFRKDAIGLRLYQQSYGSTTAYASYRDVAFTDSPTFTGQVVVAAGTSAAPAIVPTGNSNTGIFFPTADTLSLGTAGAERLRIESNGFVGIGLTASYRLDVASYAATPLRVQRSGEYGEVLKIGRYGVSDGAGIGYPADNVFSIITNANERMRITSSGNVGIGTNSPTSELHVYANGGVADLMVETNTTGGDSKIALKCNGTGGRHWYFQTGDNASTLNGRLRIFDNTAGAERLTITSAGNVGIGTSSPVVRLDLGGSIGEKLNLYTGGVNRIGFGVDMGQTINGLSSFTNSAFNWGIWDGTTFTERMRLNSSGNLGIGTATPGALLDLYSSAARIKFNRGNSYNLSFGIHDSSTSGLSIKDFNDTNTLVYFDYTGNVGIGTVTPQSLLHIGSGHGVKMSIGGSNWASKNIIETGSEVWGEWTDILVAGASPNTATSRIRLASNGNVGIGIGATRASAKLEVAGGVSLSGTLTFNGSTGSSGQVLTSQGSSAPIWTTPSQVDALAIAWLGL